MTRFNFLLIAVLICLHASAGSRNESRGGFNKILTISVDINGITTMGRDTIVIPDLAKELKSRLWKSYLGTDRMHDSIKLEFTGEIPENIKTALLEAIRNGQKLALKDICIQRYKKSYEDLSSNQQERIKKHFPVLFQTDYS